MKYLNVVRACLVFFFILVMVPTIENNYFTVAWLEWLKLPQPAFKCSKSTRKTLEQGVKYVQS